MTRLLNKTILLTACLLSFTTVSTFTSEDFKNMACEHYKAQNYVEAAKSRELEIIANIMFNKPTSAITYGYLAAAYFNLGNYVKVESIMMEKAIPLLKDAPLHVKESIYRLLSDAYEKIANADQVKK